MPVFIGIPVSLTNGGTGVSLSDPGADRVLFWDDSAGAVTWLTMGTNLSITGTTLNATGGGGGTPASPDTAVQFNNSGSFAGSANFEWDGTTVNFTAAHGLSFAGTVSPITIVGGDDGSGDSALILGNADDYIPIRTTAPDLDLANSGTQFLGLYSTSVDLAFDANTGFHADASGVTIAGDELLWNDTRSTFWKLHTNIPGGNTEPAELEQQQFARADSGTDFFESFLTIGGRNATTTASIVGMGGFGHYTALGVLTDYEMYLFDFVQNKPFLTIASTSPSTVNLGTGYSFTVPGSISTATGLQIQNGYFITDAVDAHTITFQAYDVDGTAYKTFATLTNANTPSFVITPPSGGTVTVNATTLQQAGSTITLGGALTTSGAFASTFTMTNTTSVTFPTSGTLATTSQIPSGAALTKADDTNVTLTLGGSPTTALINAASITAGWTGTLAVGRGGTGTGSAGIGAFNNITGLSAAGTTGTTSTNLVFSTSPTLTTPVLGVATATSLNGLTISTTTGTFALTNGKTLSVSNTLTFTGTDTSSVNCGAGGTVQYTGITKRISILNFALLPDTSSNVWMEPAALTQTNDRYPQMVARFKDSATKDSLGIRFMVPSDYVGSPKMYFLCTSTATSGNFVMTLDYSSSSVTSSLDPSADEENLTVTQAAPGASQTGVFPFVTLTAADLAANDVFQGKVSRNGASGSDTMAADLVVYDVIFEYMN
jgi:hypothetical protein